MTDRELLELAAKAAGLKVHARNQAERDALIDPETASLWIVNGSTAWNPLTDDGDALRLAVKLGIEPRFLDRNVSVCAPRVTLHNFGGIVVVVDGDACAATRRAITRAAAEIGKAMP